MASTSDYIPFAARPGWSDLTPIPQADAPNALVPIAYTEKCASIASAVWSFERKGADGAGAQIAMLWTPSARWSRWMRKARGRSRSRAC